MKLLCFNTDKAGCYWYRLYTPLSKIKENCPKTFDFSFEFSKIEDVDDYDVCLLQRNTDALSIELAERCRDKGIPIIYECDDSLFNIVSSNPAHNYYERPDIRYCIEYLMKMADHMTVSTENLRSYYEHLCNNISVLPNSISLSYAPTKVAIKPLSNIKLSILITGGISHKGDWTFLYNDLSSLVYDSKGRVSITMFGYVPAEFNKMPNMRVVSPVKVDQYRDILSSIDFDLMLCPLEDIPFNSYKSNLKFVEAGSLQKPIIASNVDAYNKDIQHGVNGWVLENSKYAWTRLLRSLVNNAEVIREAGKRAYETVRAGYDLDNNWKLWAEVYNKVVLSKGRSSRLIDLEERVHD